MRTISIGKQNFASLREKDFFYADKTDFIREWRENGDDVTLIARPRLVCLPCADWPFQVALSKLVDEEK